MNRKKKPLAKVVFSFLHLFITFPVMKYLLIILAVVLIAANQSNEGNAIAERVQGSTIMLSRKEVANTFAAIKYK